MGVLSGAAILAADDTSVLRVRVAGWRGEVCVRVMSAAERVAWEDWATAAGGENAADDEAKAKPPRHVAEEFLFRVLSDDAGARLWPESLSPSEREAVVAALGKKDSRIIYRLFTIAQRHNRLTAADLEELAGNSAGAPPAAPSSDSPSDSD